MTNNIPEKSEQSEIGSYNCSSNSMRDSLRASKRASKLEEHYVEATHLMVMRHSERLDDCCPGWIEKSIKNGKYEQYDLNMPTRLPIPRPLNDYLRDTVLTRSGAVLAQMVGRGLAMTENVPDVIYCSPSLRCLQTATYVRDVSGSKALIRVEPGIFENFRYPTGVPCFLTSVQRRVFPVDRTYRPFLSLATVVCRQETNKQYNERIRRTLREIVSTHEIVGPKPVLKVLVVAHASTVDMAVGLMREKPRLTKDDELDQIAIPVPYCSIAYLRKKKKQLWVPNPHVIPPVTYEFLTNRYNPHFVHRA